jgi:phosphate transport system substrate-binding protein
MHAAVGYFLSGMKSTLSLLLMSALAVAQPRIRCWGSAQLAELVEFWEVDFARSHSARFENGMYGAASAMGGLYGGAADLVVSREVWPIESMAFEQVLGYPPVALEVATGSFDVPTKSDSLDIFVHKSSAITRLTFTELAAIFSGKDTRFHTYGYLLDNAGTRLFESRVMGADSRFGVAYRPFGNVARTGSERIDAGQLILDALARDPAGIAISNIHYANAHVKLVAVSEGDGKPYVLPTRATVQDRTYPLTRSVYVFIKRDASAAVVGFVRYLLSAAGQAKVAQEGGYLPLTPEVMRSQAFILHSLFPE